MIELDPADATTASALALTRAELSPSGADKARLRAALGLAAPPAAPATGSGGAPSTTSAAPLAPAAPAVLRLTRLAGLRASAELGVALGALLFGAGVVTGWALQARTPRAPDAGAASVALPAAPAASAPAAVPRLESVAAPLAEAARPAGAEAEANTADEASRPSTRVRAHAPAPSTPSSVEPLGAELALLRRVERALRNGDPALALALLGELDRRFPQTRLAEERLAARRMAECRQRAPDAALQARAFLRDHPASVYSERVQTACELETTPAAPLR